LALEKETPINFSSTEYVTAVSHYYRGEINRSNVWRSRLDVTTNWAIVTTGAFVSVGFGSKEMPHFVIILATIFVLFFLIIESRRYKYFDLWRWRVEMLSENFFATLFDPEKGPKHKDWQERLNYDLQYPNFKISFMEAFGRRLRRNYLWVFMVLATCWLIKISIHPTPLEQFTDIITRGHIFNMVPGWMVFSIGLVFNISLVVIALITNRKRKGILTVYPAAKKSSP